jgi:hypothetical protein
LPAGSTHAIKFYDLNKTYANKANKDIFDNHSRYSQNLIAGSAYKVVRKYVPGYTGRVPGIISESIISESYDKCTAKAIGKRYPKGLMLSPKSGICFSISLRILKIFRRIGM